MAFSVSPSVIVREVDASAAVPAIATPPAAITGIFQWGPVNDPILITTEDELVDRFGAPTSDNYETWFAGADFLSYSNALYVVRADNGSTKADHTKVVLDGNNDIIVDQTNYGVFQAAHVGSRGNDLEVAYVSADGYQTDIAAVGDITANRPSNTQIAQEFSFNSNSVVIEVANTAQLTGVSAGDVLTVGNASVGYAEMQVATFTEASITNAGANTDPAATDDDFVQYYRYTITFSNRYPLAEENLNKVSFVKKWKHANLFGKAPDAGHLHIGVIDAGGGITGTAGTVLERFENVSSSVNATLPQGTSNYYKTVIDNFSKWVDVANTAPIGTASTSISKYERLGQTATGTVGSDAQTESNASLAAYGFAVDTLKNSNEIDISSVIVGKSDDSAQRANYILSNVVETRKDCVMYVSPSKESVVDELKTNTKLTNVIAHRNKIQNSSYAFMDSGYKYRYDKYNDVYRYTPLCGDMAGLASRVETWESPAGFRKGLIKNVIKLAFNPSKPQRDQLYSSDINPVMAQAGSGIMLFGDKTMLGQASAFDRINVRRLFIAVEKSIATAAESFLFELNDEFTQTQFRNIVDPFLRDIQGRRGIIDFRVISDSRVNTPEVIDQNKFRASIFIKPARSINVIELTFVATRTGVEFDEIVGQLT